MLTPVTAKLPKEAMRLAESRPQEAQRELADARLKGRKYRTTPDELAGIDRGLKAARKGRFATDTEVEAEFARHRLA
jgi:predicted transcriptional regulator